MHIDSGVIEIVILKICGAISDPFILGLANISYLVGTLTLTDTNFDLGPPENIASLSPE